MAKKAKKKVSYSPTARTGQIGPDMPTAMMGANPSLTANLGVGNIPPQMTAKYSPNEQLRAKMPTDMTGVKNQIEEREMIMQKTPMAVKKEMPKKKKASKKVTPKKAPKKGTITYVKSVRPIMSDASDAPKY